jgi:hypothetical protein
MRRSSKPYAVCIDNRGQEASLIRGKIYRVRPDARAKKDDLIRVIDEVARIICSMPTSLSWSTFLSQSVARFSSCSGSANAVRC